jgi:hypothetical protein
VLADIAWATGRAGHNPTAPAFKSAIVWSAEARGLVGGIYHLTAPRLTLYFARDFPLGQQVMSPS